MNETVLQVPGWQEIAWLRHGFGTRRGGVSSVYLPPIADDATRGGDLNTGWTASDDPANVVENRRRLVAAAGIDAALTSLVTLRQVHSTESLVVREPIMEFFTEQGRAAFEADGLMTGALGVVLGVQTADCVPVLVADARLRVVAAFHAGWRGTVAGIVERGVAQMAAEFGSRAEDLIAAVGPSIGACCYSVGDEVLEAFRRDFAYAEELFERRGDSEPKVYVDLWEANRRQLLDSGVPSHRVSVVEECTGCTGWRGERRYFSHRCEKGFTGRMMSVIGVAG